MIEIAHPVESIMAIQAIFTELADMFRHEYLVMFGMAFDTRLTSELIYPAWVTGLTFQSLASVVQLMACE